MIPVSVVDGQVGQPVVESINTLISSAHVQQRPHPRPARWVRRMLRQPRGLEPVDTVERTAVVAGAAETPPAGRRSHSRGRIWCWER